jgi:hypothetical protein
MYDKEIKDDVNSSPSDASSSKSSIEISSTTIKRCKNTIIDEDLNSIASDNCYMWSHFRCLGLTIDMAKNIT